MMNLANIIPQAAKTETIGGREVAMVYTTLEEEYAALRQDCGFIDCSDFLAVRISGDGAAEYLDRLCTKDIQFLNIDMLAECMMLNDEGDSLGIVWVMNVGDDYLLMTAAESAAEVLAWMQAHVPEDVTIREITDQALVAIEGRYSWRIMRDVLDVDVNGMPLRGIQEVKDFAGDTLLLARIGRTGEYGYLAMGDPETIQRYVESCFSYVENEGLKLQFVGREAIEICMLETSQPDFRYENRSKGSVFELGQQWLIQYEKEDYIGREKLMERFEAGQNRAAVLFIGDKDSGIADGDAVCLEDECVGSVVHAVYSPGNDKTIGIALLRRDLAVSGICLTAGKGATIEMISSPVIRPRSWDERIEE